MPMRWVPSRKRAEILRDLADVLMARRLDRHRLAMLLHEYAYEVEEPERPKVWTLDEMQREVVIEALRKCGSAAAAARALRVTGFQVRSWIKRHRLPIESHPGRRPTILSAPQPAVEIVVPYHVRERECMVIALAEAKGNLCQAADKLGIGVGRLRRMIDRHVHQDPEAAQMLRAPDRRPPDGDWEPATRSGDEDDVSDG